MANNKFCNESIVIVGQYKGRGGVQTVHRDLLNAYRKRGHNIHIIYNLRTFFKFLFKSNQKTKITYFSGLSILLAPFFLKCEKHIFFTHGFYVYEYFNKDLVRSLKRIIYDSLISFSLSLYKWVFCIAPSPISGLVNSIKFSRKTYVVPWGISDDYINYPLIHTSYKYHLTFLGRANSQKITKSSLDTIIKLFINSEVVKSPSDLKFSFLIPKLNKYTESIISQLKDIYDCKIDIYENQSNENIRDILSQTLYLFSCFEWEAFGLTYIEALCMGCNILIPSTSPIIPLIEGIDNAPVYKYKSSNLLSFDQLKNNIKLTNNRPSFKKVQYYRFTFNWDIIIDNIHELVNA